MVSERMRRRIERLLAGADSAADRHDWIQVRKLAYDVLLIDEANQDAESFVELADRGSSSLSGDDQQGRPAALATPVAHVATPDHIPTAFSNGRYEMQRFLGEGGKKMVYLAQDTLFDRDVAFALIKTEGLDDVSRTRISREAQAMGRLGSHPHIVTVFDIGDHEGQPFMVVELLGGGDVEGILEDAEDGKLPP